jgi:hypothetical protein
MATQFTSGRFSSEDAVGAPLIGGRLYSYVSGTTTFKTAYADALLVTPCTYASDGLGGQYITLNARGEAQVWLGVGTYSFILKDSTGTTVWSVDGVVGEAAAATPAPAPGALGGVAIANFTLSTASPPGSGGGNFVAIANTVPNGWNTASGRCELQFDFVSHSYFAANPVGHVAIGTRFDTVAADPRFSGVAMGNLTGATGGPDFAASMQLESKGLAPGGARQLSFQSVSPRGKPLLDNVRYRVTIETTVVNSERFQRYRLERYVSAVQAYDLEMDTGDVPDPNVWFDPTKTGLIFAHVFESNLVPWSIDFDNAKVVWGPATETRADQAWALNRYGAEMEGPLSFKLPGFIYIKCDTTDIRTWTAFKNGTANAPTNVLAMPNGTSVISGYIATNNPTGVTYQYVKFGINGGVATVETFGVGMASPNLETQVGGVVVTRHEGTKFRVLTATEMAGALTFTAAGYINTRCDTTDILTWTAFKNATLNGPTNVLAVPNGTSAISGYIAANNPAGVTYQYVKFGINGAIAKIETFGVGMAVPNLETEVGGVRITKHEPTGLRILAAAETIGPTTTRLMSPTNWGGTNALLYSNGPSASGNIDTTCAVGTIAALMSATPTNAQVETVVRPLYCLLSALVAEMQAKKIL